MLTHIQSTSRNAQRNFYIHNGTHNEYTHIHNDCSKILRTLYRTNTKTQFLMMMMCTAQMHSFAIIIL